MTGRGRKRTVVLVGVVVIAALVATVGVFLVQTRDQVSGHCLAFETIGGLSDGFSAPATVVDRTVLTARVGPERAAQLRVGQEVDVPDTLAGTRARAWVIGVDRETATITLQPPPQIAVVIQPPSAILRPGATGQVTILTLSISKTQLEPTAALRPVPGRPGLFTVLGYRAPAPPEVKALHVLHAVGPYAQTALADRATAISVGADPDPTPGQGALLIPDRFCRAAGLWPPVLDHDVIVSPAP